MPTDLTKPDPQGVLDLLEAFRRSKVMFAGVSLGVFDALSGGGKTVAQLAAELKADQAALERLLNAIVGLQLLMRDGDQFRNSPAASAYLCRNSPDRMTGYINYSNTVLWRLWEHLEDAVREGTHRWNQVFGWDTPIFSNFFRTEDSMREFLMGMHGFGVISSPHVVAAFDLSRFRHFVDLGGATGHLAVAACERYPQLRATVFDLPEATAMAREMVAASPVSDRVQVVGGDFFADPLPTADIYALGRIIHDWSPEKVNRLLKRAFEALPPQGALLIAEKLLWADKSGPTWAQMQDLNMLTCAEGRERTLDEYEALLLQAGFSRVQGLRTRSPLDAIFAEKA